MNSFFLRWVLWSLVTFLSSYGFTQIDLWINDWIPAVSDQVIASNNFLSHTWFAAIYLKKRLLWTIITLVLSIVAGFSFAYRDMIYKNR